MKITISAKATDSESGIASLTYSVSPATIKTADDGTTKATGKLNPDGTPIEIETTAEGDYTITFTATDLAGKTATKEITGIKTGEVIKHIKLSDGTLKEVKTKDIYGADVLGYTCGRSDVEWQVFYIDEDDDHRVYLIAKDYAVPPVNNSSVTPKLLAGGSSNYPKAYMFGTNYEDQSVLGSFTGNLPSTTATAPLGKFINDYLKEYSSGVSASRRNLQATNLMLNQEMWSEYKGTKADLAFGGPTLSLFQASYNDVSRTSTKLGIQQSGTGYQVKKGTGSFANDQGGFGDSSTQKGIYFMGANVGSANGMWLASPSSQGTDYVKVAHMQGIITNDYEYGYDLFGFRPIVSLKSNVRFTSNADGTVYTIAN